MKMTAQEAIARLGLVPHPKEGGFFRETYRSSESISDCLPARYGQTSRSVATAIYYLLTPDTCSRMHRIKSDEVFHFYLGDPVQMLWIYENGRSERVFLGSDISHGFRPQAVVPQGVWQGAFLIDGGTFALLGTTVAPGFCYEDYEEGQRQDLILRYPQEKDLITRLTF